MLRSVEHRGPDDWGMYFLDQHAGGCPPTSEHVLLRASPHVRLALGHRRLSILDLSAAGRQPMHSSDGNLTLVYNGEIYNYVELRQELERRTVFRTRTDTEVLLEAYRQWGVEMLRRLDGMFAFALWDARAEKLVCARDPLGIKPFYYGRNDQLFVFASEPQAVLLGLGTSGHADACRVAEFLVLGVADHDEGTSFQEVQQLRGGHWLEVDSRGTIARKERFWQLPAVGGDGGDQVPARLREQLERAVLRQLRSDVPVGSCLSGGIDSASIVTTAARVLGPAAADFTALTVTSRNFDGNEASLAQVTARQAGVRWVQVESSISDLSTDLDRFVRVMGEPFWSLSMYGQYKVMQEARQQGLRVMLDGQGGDEVFLGYPRLARRVAGEYFRRGNPATAFAEWVAFRRKASDSLLASTFGGLYFQSPDLVRWRNSERIRGLIAPELLEQVRREIAEDMFSAEAVERTQVKELTRYYLPALLRYEDRNSMAFGLEARVPLLATELVETGLRLPLRWKVNQGWTKYGLRMAMRGQVPPEVLWQGRKRSFEVPQQRWIEAARAHIGSRLEELPRDGVVNAAAILKRLDEGQGGAPWLWRCVSVALWMRGLGVSW